MTLKIDPNDTSAFQRACDEFVRRNVTLCVSSLVSDLAAGYGEKLPGNLSELAEEAFELCTPIPDWEEACLQEGISVKERDGEWQWASDKDIATAEDWTPGDGESEEDRPNPWEALSADDESEAYREAAEENRLDPYEREIYEHWVIDRWLAARLAEHGEKTGTLGDFTVWGRTTTGQSISMDGVIGRIFNETWNRVHA